MNKLVKGLLVCGAAILTFFVLLIIIMRPISAEIPVGGRTKVAPDVPFALAGWVNTTNATGFVDFGAIASANPGLQAQDGGVLFARGQSITVPVSVSDANNYKIVLRYAPVMANMNNYLFGAGVGDQFLVTEIQPVWMDETPYYFTDSFGNEFMPPQINVMAIIDDFLRVHDSVNKLPAVLSIAPGDTLYLNNMGQEVILHGIFFMPYIEPPTFADYLSAMLSIHPDRMGRDMVVINGEDYSLKSDSFIQGRPTPSLDLYPYDTFRRLINNLSGTSWRIPGQKVLWEFEIEDPGFYYIVINYLADDGGRTISGSKNTFRSIEINGERLFAEFDSYMFPWTGRDNYERYTLSADGSYIRIFLDRGRHTISMTATTADKEEIVDELTRIMDKISHMGVDLSRLAAGSIDMSRTWDMNNFLPHIVPAMFVAADEIDEIFDRIYEANRTDPVFARGLLIAANRLRTLATESHFLPNRIDQLSEGDTSVNAMLGAVLAQLLYQPMGIDRIFIHGGHEPLPQGQHSFLRSLAETVHVFMFSFSPDAIAGQMIIDTNREEDVLEVWAIRPMQFAETLRVIVNRDYDQSSNTNPNFDRNNVRISHVNDVQRLILANASGTNPDVVVGLEFTRVAEFAMRRAVLNLLDFDDFLPFYMANYAVEALRPMSFNGGVYGVVDGHDLPFLFYRTDIFDAHGLEVPNTWDDVRNILPHFHRYSMNVNLPSASAGLDPMNRTLSAGFSPFIYQYGGSLFSPCGFYTAINTPASLYGFAQLTDMFRIYGARQDVANFFNDFRFGTVPMGVGTLATYVQLQVAAPELAGRWNVALVPGVQQEDGTIDRGFPSARFASMIFANTNHPEFAFDFLQWWLSTETQRDYAYMLRQTFGPEFVWIPGNLHALEQMFFQEDHMGIILEQRENLREIMRHPAGYMLERSLIDSWTDVVVDGQNRLLSVDRAATRTNREIMRKMAEFGFVDGQGNIINEFITDTPERVLQMYEEGRR